MTSLTHDDKILGLFHGEATELIQGLNRELLLLEAREDVAKCTTQILRSAHSLKGAAGATGLVRVERMAHAWESFVKAIQQEKVPISEQSLQLLFRALDTIEAEVAVGCTGIRPPTMDPPPSVEELAEVFHSELSSAFAPESGPSHESDQAKALQQAPGIGAATLRVGTDKVDSLMANVEQLMRVKGGAHALRDVSTLVEELVASQALLARPTHRRASGNGLTFDATVAKEIHRRLASLIESATRLETEVNRHAHRLDQLASTLQDDIRAVRMVPVDSILAPFPRLVRDLAKRLGRKVELVISGGEAELDRDLLEPLRDALVHLLRNAVAHGIEPPEKRKAAGKSPLGRIDLKLSRRGGSLEVAIQDDGRGFDLAGIKRSAIRAGLLRDGDAVVDEATIKTLAFRSGVTTARQVDEISGRGVGLDAVRRAMERCGGSVSVQSRPGEGSVFDLRMPLSIATMRILLVGCGAEQFAVPLSGVQRILRLTVKDLIEVDSRSAIEIDGRPVPVMHLENLVGSPTAPAQVERRPALVLASGLERVAVLVGTVVGEQELVVKSLGYFLDNVAEVTGATVLPTGEIVPLLSVSEMVRRGTLGRGATTLTQGGAVEAKRRRILVADDSITTRTLEKSILEAVGFEVIVATDGLDALEKLRDADVDLVLSDVHMPRMSGIDLVKRMKQEEASRHIPVVLVSSLDSTDDRKRGLDAGADAYLSKQEFRQEVLLQTIERLT